jgi:transposase
MRKLDSVGIDVSAKTLVVAIDRGRGARMSEFSNDSGGHQRLCLTLTKGGRRARVCLESTGIYGLDLAFALHRASCIEVMVANPRAIHDFGRAKFVRTKTDVTDARVILEYVKAMPFRPWQPPPQEILDLRGISRRITSLSNSVTRERNRLHAAEGQSELTGVIADDIRCQLRYLAESMESLSREALDVIESVPALKRRYELLISVRGIGTTSAIRILSELAVLPDDMTARQWVAHAGLDPRHYESGTSVHKRSRISRAGNRRLRWALYMPALVAARQEPRIKAFYEKLIQAGKKPMQALVAVMRKLLHAIHGMFTHDEQFRGEKFYALCA